MNPRMLIHIARQDQCTETCAERERCFQVVGERTAFYSCICTSTGLSSLDACDGCRLSIGRADVDMTASQQLRNDCASLGFSPGATTSPGAVQISASASGALGSASLPTSSPAVTHIAVPNDTPTADVHPKQDAARTGAIVGGVIAGVVVLLIGGFILCLRRVKQRRELKALRPRKMLTELDLAGSSGRPSKDLWLTDQPPIPRPIPVTLPSNPLPVVRTLHPFSYASSSFLPDEETMTDADAASPTSSSKYFGHFSSHSRSDSITVALLATADPAAAPEEKTRARRHTRRHGSDPTASTGLIPPTGKTIPRPSLRSPERSLSPPAIRGPADLQRSGSTSSQAGVRPSEPTSRMTEKERLAMRIENATSIVQDVTSPMYGRLESPLEVPDEEEEDHDLPPPSYSTISKRRSSRFYQMFHRLSSPPPMPNPPLPPPS